MGNTFGDRDYQMIRTRVHNIMVLKKDIVGERREITDFHVQECMNNMAEVLEDVGSNLGTLEVLIAISSKMLNASDETSVNRYIREQANYTLETLQNSREFVNATAGLCATSGIVATKAQYILNMLTEIDATLQSIAQRT